MPWERPASVPVGQVWSRFKGRQRDGKPAKMYQIRDVDESQKQLALDLMQEIFLRDEPLCHVLGILQDPVSISTIRANWEKYLSQNVSLACFTEVDGKPDELVAFNVIIAKTLDDPEEDFDKVEGESWRKLLLTLIKTEELVDVFKVYDVDTYLSCSGMTVAPEHRGQNIGVKLLEARKPLCEALGIKATASDFTALTSQALATKCGYEVLAELDYKDMAAYGVDLSHCDTPTAKVMGTKFNRKI